jgi:hypothetical protein
MPIRTLHPLSVPVQDQYRWAPLEPQPIPPQQPRTKDFPSPSFLQPAPPPTGTVRLQIPQDPTNTANPLNPVDPPTELSSLIGSVPLTS